jgi:hypothetical protein
MKQFIQIDKYILNTNNIERITKIVGKDKHINILFKDDTPSLSVFYVDAWELSKDFNRLSAELTQ